jgi:hypothetical protein
MTEPGFVDITAHPVGFISAVSQTRSMQVGDSSDADHVGNSSAIALLAFRDLAAG